MRVAFGSDVGARAFESPPAAALRLLGTRSFDASHDVLVGYAFERTL